MDRPALPGWYEDPTRGHRMYWWDGDSWLGVPGVAAGERSEPGWYPDPLEVAELRWHDGDQWSMNLSGSLDGRPLTTAVGAVAPRRARRAPVPTVLAALTMLPVAGVLAAAGQSVRHFQPDQPVSMEQMGSGWGATIAGVLLQCAAGVLAATAVVALAVAALRATRAGD